MANPITCDLCGRPIPPHAHYIVRIEVVADPSMPELSQEEIDNLDFDKTLHQLLEEMKSFSADELQDQVHRRFDYRICRPCQARFLCNPLGRPREKGQAQN
jgi:hypothetical protein